ncbi:hypothetical protein SAMN05421870_10254 [Streptomyces qinglanensis]|uniref:Uncharacterized protein n=1 Tax=Streptomyces qinglanensis TaxID=943816 RepID=A0A1H9PK36_9ACTN|nr:hypothetical protein SAMN05421870_10254 [Streptomyces qinglanensis]
MTACGVFSRTVPVAYNPDGGKRVKQAWQRYSESQRPLVAPALVLEGYQWREACL